MGLFNWGKAVEEAGNGVKAGSEGLTKLTAGIRSAITGEMPPETVERLTELAIQGDEINADLLAGQQAIESIVANRSGPFGQLFVGGWRPFIGWVIGWTLFFNYIPTLLISQYFWVTQMISEGKFLMWAPPFDVLDMITALGGLVTMGILRTVEKQQGTIDTH